MKTKCKNPQHHAFINNWKWAYCMQCDEDEWLEQSKKNHKKTIDNLNPSNLINCYSCHRKIDFTEPYFSVSFIKGVYPNHKYLGCKNFDYNDHTYYCSECAEKFPRFTALDNNCNQDQNI